MNPLFNVANMEYKIKLHKGFKIFLERELVAKKVVEVTRSFLNLLLERYRMSSPADILNPDHHRLPEYTIYWP